jgi:hypothetical protein
MAPVMPQSSHASSIGSNVVACRCTPAAGGGEGAGTKRLPIRVILARWTDGPPLPSSCTDGPVQLNARAELIARAIQTADRPPTQLQAV